ncbi:MAG: glycoside hydrolase family 9 protein [Propionibacteriaceae bacterium]|jgi:hypothetical protein|nr:glycoside hydrolase family 9 protein [Propionibacteriaceae bacterium]
MDCGSIIVNHLGYPTGSPCAVVLQSDRAATLQRVALTGPIDPTGARPSQTRELNLKPHALVRVDHWHGGFYGRIDLPVDLTAGTYNLAAELTAGGQHWTIGSPSILIDPTAGPASVLSDVMCYFKAVRSSGEIDRHDATTPLIDDPNGPKVDARGGWLDASGDTSKFLSHLTYTTMMSPQQIPLCAWAFLAARDALGGSDSIWQQVLDARLRDEALFGADFLMRFRSPQGYFYTGIFDALTKQLDERIICAPIQDCGRTARYQAAYRQGGGLAIAALARASHCGDHGDFPADDYRQAATQAFWHLEGHNLAYLWDGAESVIDDYCALLAASELTYATMAAGASIEKIWPVAVHRLQSLMGRYQTGVDGGPGHLQGDQAGRPFFHAVESGLPVLALLACATVDEQIAAVWNGDSIAQQARSLAVQLMSDWLARTDAVPNPFGYPRALMQPSDGPAEERFFFPHANETGYWWQGENANLASLAAAASATARLAQCPPDVAKRLRVLAADTLGWIGGRNPFDLSMIYGREPGSTQYDPRWPNIPGGILNGITAGVDDEHDIAFMPAEAVAHGDAWRWSEQWIPHAAWYVLAAALAVPQDQDAGTIKQSTR